MTKNRIIVMKLAEDHKLGGIVSLDKDIIHKEQGDFQ